MTRVLKTMRAKDTGAKRFTKLYGRRLIAVRYRGDAKRRVCMTTVEIVVAERFWMPHRRSVDAMMRECLNMDIPLK